MRRTATVCGADGQRGSVQIWSRASVLIPLRPPHDTAPVGPQCSAVVLAQGVPPDPLALRTAPCEGAGAVRHMTQEEDRGG
eukprot:CAMPEP_0174348028 /NCGR_PEP_ID=MMETSP0811_2-20130205/4338_1 /TAXON_ID=73025 ORGANISM="Eutreptiella gymnastica-like, Strain CCMP1594" /NCGR_SAMPLE_ID=MMETSP0811_2 /ASSEMBLY_ACC=CAM_ASM_000667 /LENGTH=80 /DNA_ID=CAMNT_0015474177 /DNA_START=194 /DNA_END=433 /DNA_ORIENTATION=-